MEEKKKAKTPKEELRDRLREHLKRTAMRSHPTPTLLDRFLRGAATASENRAVVRHLLTGCARCLVIIRPAWTAAERLAGRRAPHPHVPRRQRDLHR